MAIHRRKFIQRSLIAAPVMGGGLYGYGRLLERHHVEMVHVQVSVGLSRSLRIGVLGDIHFDPLFESEYVRSCIQAASDMSPDVLVFTGDYVSESLERIDVLANTLSDARARLGVFAILGNHDHWAGADAVSSSLTRIGFQVLRNESVLLEASDGIYLTGLESYWAGRPQTTCIERTPLESRHIVLVHEPDPFDTLVDRRIALQISGHTHGGQIRLPIFGALELPSWGRKYQAGLYRDGGRLLYVNRGIGTVDQHVRINCRPEITMFDVC